MRSTTPITWKTCNQLDVGELARMKLGQGQATFLKLDNTKQGSLIGILKSSTIDGPILLDFQANHFCISFGADWVFDPKFAEEAYPSNPQRYELAAGAFVDENGFGMTFPPNPESHSVISSIHFSISENKITERSDNFAPLLNWSIWHSIWHSETGDHEPIVSV